MKKKISDGISSKNKTDVGMNLNDGESAMQTELARPEPDLHCSVSGTELFAERPSSRKLSRQKMNFHSRFIKSQDPDGGAGAPESDESQARVGAEGGEGGKIDRLRNKLRSTMQRIQLKNQKKIREASVAFSQGSNQILNLSVSNCSELTEHNLIGEGSFHNYNFQVPRASGPNCKKDALGLARLSEPNLIIQEQDYVIRNQDNQYKSKISKARNLVVMQNNTNSIKKTRNNSIEFNFYDEKYGIDFLEDEEGKEEELIGDAARCEDGNKLNYIDLMKDNTNNQHMAEQEACNLFISKNSSKKSDFHQNNQVLQNLESHYNRAQFPQNQGADEIQSPQLLTTQPEIGHSNQHILRSLGGRNIEFDPTLQQSPDINNINPSRTNDEENSVILSEVPVSKKKVSFKFREWKSVNVNRKDFRTSNLLKKEGNNNHTIIEKLQIDIDANKQIDHQQSRKVKKKIKEKNKQEKKRKKGDKNCDKGQKNNENQQIRTIKTQKYDNNLNVLKLDKGDKKEENNSDGQSQTVTKLEKRRRLSQNLEFTNINDQLKTHVKRSYVNSLFKRVQKQILRLFQQKNYQKRSKDWVKQMNQMKEMQEADSQRIQYLWHRVRTTVKSQLFLVRLQKEKTLKLDCNQASVMKKKDLKQFEMYIKYKKQEQEDMLMCLVKHKSLCNQIWTILSAVIYVLSLFLILYTRATNSYFLLEMRAQNTLQLICYFNFVDILVNLVTEKVNNSGEIEKYMKFSFMIYLKSSLLFDLSNLLGFFTINLEFARLNLQFGQAQDHPYNEDKCFAFDTQLKQIAQFVCIFNLVRVNKLIAGKEVVENLLQEQHSNLKLIYILKNLFLLTYYLLFQILTIFVFTFLYVFYSSQIQKQICVINEQHFDHVFLKVKEHQNSKVNHDISAQTFAHAESKDQMFMLLFHQSFLLLTTLTTVGYGCDMPSFSEQANDTLVLSLIIMFGVMTFSKYISELQLKFKQRFSEKSIFSQLVENDQNIDAYFINHNQLWNVRQMQSNDLQTFKKGLKLNYHFNFKKVHQDDFFNELPPQLKNKLEKILVRRQKKQFHQFFNDKLKNEKINNRLVRNILSKLSCKIYLDKQTVMAAKEVTSCIYFINKGYVNVYDKYYNYLTQYSQGDFFGEYQIMFNLHAGQIYKADQKKKKVKRCEHLHKGGADESFSPDEIILFHIEKEVFLELICRDESNCFEFYNNLAIHKYKKIQKLKKKVYERMDKALSQMAANFGMFDDKEKVSLYTILELQSKMFSINSYVQATYDKIRQQRRDKNYQPLNNVNHQQDQEKETDESIGSPITKKDKSLALSSKQASQSNQDPIVSRKQIIKEQIAIQRKRTDQISMRNSMYTQRPRMQVQKFNSPSPIKSSIIEMEGGEKISEKKSEQDSGSLKSFEKSETSSGSDSSKEGSLSSGSQHASSGQRSQADTETHKNKSENNQISQTQHELTDSDNKSNSSKKNQRSDMSVADNQSESSNSSQELQVDSDDQVDVEEIVDYFRYEELINNIEYVIQLDSQMHKVQVLFQVSRDQFSGSMKKVQETINKKTIEFIEQMKRK